MSDNLEMLASAVEAAGAEVVKQSEDSGSIKLLCRVKYKKVWCDILEYVLVRKRGWDAHICQQYFIKSGKLVYGWNVIFQPENGMDEATKNAFQLFSQAIRVVARMSEEEKIEIGGQIESFPLIGASPSRTAPIERDPKTGVPIHRGGAPINLGK